VPDAAPATERGHRHVALVGAMGSGKTTVGVPLAAALNQRYVDNDEQLLRTTGLDAAHLAVRDGVDALHAAEAEAVLAALRAPEATVIGAAASTIVDPVVRRELAASAFVVWLRADAATLAVRTPQSPTRPFAGEDPARLVAEQARERDPLFAGAADLTVRTDDHDPAAIVAEIVAAREASERG